MEAIAECKLCPGENTCVRTYTIGKPETRVILDQKGKQKLVAGSIEECAMRNQILENAENIRKIFSTSK